MIVVILYNNSAVTEETIGWLLNSEETPHALPSRMSYGVSILVIWRQFDSVIMAPQQTILLCSTDAIWTHSHLTSLKPLFSTQKPR